METSRPRRKKKKKRPSRTCDCCQGEFRFCWSCRSCPLAICQPCMEDNRWGVTCNNITWQCPDCGEWNGYGNQ